jgi:hypothetical protein
MPSPFPGMNPYIERASVWHDFHKSWIPLAANLLNAQVLPRYLSGSVNTGTFTSLLNVELRRLISNLFRFLKFANWTATSRLRSSSC